MKIGLVLSGGMVKGAYQIGVLEAMQEFIKKEDIACISTASIGTITSYAFEQDRLEELKRLWLDTEQFNIRSFLRSSVKRSNILDKVSEIVKEHKPMGPDFYTTCLDVNRMKLDYINLKEVKEDLLEDYLKAAISFPPVYKAMQVGNVKYVDGAVIDNIPVNPLAKYDLDYIIVVHFDKDKYVYKNFENKNIIEINFNTQTSLAKSLSFDQDSSNEMIRKGYKQAYEVLSFVFANGVEDKDYTTNAINYLNDNYKQKDYNMCGDVLVDRMNTFAKKFVTYDMKQVKKENN